MALGPFRGNLREKLIVEIWNVVPPTSGFFSSLIQGNLGLQSGSSQGID